MQLQDEDGGEGISRGKSLGVVVAKGQGMMVLPFSKEREELVGERVRTTRQLGGMCKEEVVIWSREARRRIMEEKRKG